MAFDFPASPTNGQIFTPPGGPTYVWNGSAWAGAGVTPTIGVLSTAETRSRIVNGAMQISQENGSSAITTIGYVCDQWRYGFGLVGTVAAARAVNTININIGTANPVLAAGDSLTILQPIEGIRIADFGWGAAGARPIVLRFSFVSGVAGTYAVAIRNGATNRSYIAPFTVVTPGVWETHSVAIPGDTSGTWPVDTSLAMWVSIVAAAGTTLHGTANVWQAGNKLGFAGMANAASITGPHIFLANVGLYLDPNNTGVAPPWQMPDEAEELRACQRYWERAFGAYRTQAPAGGLVGSWAPFLVQKRVVPIISSFTNGTTGGASTGGAIATDVMGIGVQFTHAANSDAYNYGYNAVANARM